MKISIPTIMDILQETDEDLHRKIFIQAANDVVLRSVPKLNTQIKKKFNINMKKLSPYRFAVASRIDGVFSAKTGFVNFSQATQTKPVITIAMDGSPINDSRFDMSFDKEIKAAEGLKKQKGLIRRSNRVSKVDRGRPRVKILRSRSPKMLGSAFYATMPNGHSGIFRRKDKGIIELRTITLASMLQQVNYDALLENHYKLNMTKRYDHYLTRMLRKG